MPMSFHHARYSLRLLLRNKRFSALAIVSLGLAIGLNTTMYSVLDSLINPTLDMRDHERLYRIVFIGDMRRRVPQHDKLEALQSLTIHEGLATYFPADGVAEHGTEFRLARVVNVSPNFFAVTGVRANAGRLMAASDQNQGPRPVVVSLLLWRQFFPDQAWFDTATVLLDGEPRPVVGVLPYTADFPGWFTDVWQLATPAELSRFLPNVIRIKPNVTFQEAAYALDAVAKRIGAQAGEGPRDVRYRIQPAIGDPFRYQRFHLAMIGAVVAVLLVACVNLANLQLARGLTRARELAIRAAIGASRRDLILQLLGESAWLAAAGLLLGLALTYWGMHIVTSSVPQSLSEFVVRPQTSWRLFAFSALAALLSLAMIGLGPAIQLSRVDINELLKSGAGTGKSRTTRRQYGALVVVQVGLALSLLIAAALLLRGAAELFRVKLGWQYENMVWAFPRVVAQTRGDSLARVTDISSSLVRRARATPNVVDATTLRFSRPRDRGIALDDPGGTAINIGTGLWNYALVSPSMIRTIGGEIVKGRDFSEEEFAEQLAIVDERTSRYLWPGADPIGRMIKLGTSITNAPWVRVIGVVRPRRDSYTARTSHEVEKLTPGMGVVYVLQATDTARVGRGIGMQLLVRGSRDVHRLPLLLRRSLAELRPAVVTFRIYRYEDAIGIKSLRERRSFVAALFSTFALLALVVAGLGVYAVVSHSVSQRTREFGVRIALGASERDIRRSVLYEGNVLALSGIAVGLVISAKAVWWLMAFLQSEDDVYASGLFGLAALVLFGVTLLASYIPARRAMRINPVEALRND